MHGTVIATKLKKHDYFVRNDKYSTTAICENFCLHFVMMNSKIVKPKNTQIPVYIYRYKVETTKNGFDVTNVVKLYDDDGTEFEFKNMEEAVKYTIDTARNNPNKWCPHHGACKAAITA